VKQSFQKKDNVSWQKSLVEHEYQAIAAPMKLARDDKK